MPRVLHVIGSGGHAKVLVATARAAGFEVAALYDDNESVWGDELLGAPITGPTSRLLEQRDVEAVIAIGENSVRRRIDSEVELRWARVVHPTAFVHESVSLDPGTVVLAGAIVQPDARIGRHVILNTGATVDHDCRVGGFAHLAPGSHLAGSVTVEEGVFLGTGALAIPQVRIGAWTTVGAGGVVIRDLPDRVVAVGVPARVIREKS